MKKRRNILIILLILFIILIITIIAILINLIKSRNFYIDGEENPKYTENIDDYINAMENKIIAENQSENTNNKKEEKKVIKKEYNIEPNDNNKIFKYTLSDEMFCWMLLNNYRDYCLYNQEKAYELLNEEYKKERFKNLDGFKEYIQDAYKTIQEAYVYKYIKKKYNDYTEYTILDQHENYYTFKCFGGYNYEVILDIYTLNTQIYLSGYTKGSAQERVRSNIRKFIDMINSKDFTNAYDCLSEKFRKNKYSTKEIFKKYIKENMYEYSEIVFEEFKVQGNLYIYNIKLSERNAPAHPVKNMQIIMKLKEGINFELSFNME